MENHSNAVAGAMASGDVDSVLQIREDRRAACEAYKDLQILEMPRTNLHLVGTAGAIRIVLEWLRLDLREPIVTWRPGQRLELPSPRRAATLLLHDVSKLTSDEQHRLVRWLDETAGQVRVVSTSAVPLWPRVQHCAFDDVLYYRLNIVCVDVTANDSCDATAACSGS